MRLTVTKETPKGKNIRFENSYGQSFTLNQLLKNPPSGYHYVDGPTGPYLRSNPDGNKRNNLG